MSPGRRSPRPPDGRGRPTLDALRAQLEAAERTPPGGGGPRKARRAGTRRRRQAGEWDEVAEPSGEDGFGEQPDDEPLAEAPTPLDDADDGPGRRWWDDHAGRPIPVEHGIVAATRRGRIGATWWSRRFLDSLEAVLVGGRMERGRSYARKGQVVSLTLGPGTVAAVVQGSREEPYQVRLSMPVVADDDWQRIVAALGAQARYAALLLAGELPHEVEQVFDASGASLFPGPQARLVTECTCPDFENPCKHIAAVCYLLAEMFDQDPFRVLEWRGRDRHAVVSELRQLRSAPAAGAVPGPGEGGQDEGGGGGVDAAAEADQADADEVEQPEQELLADGFWDAGPGLSEVHVRPVAAPVPDAVLRQLPHELLTVGGSDLANVLAAGYETFTVAAAQRAAR